MNKKDFVRSSELCDSVLSTYPISLTCNYYKGISLHYDHPDSKDYTRYRDRYIKLVIAILSSGNGLTCKTGFKTISVSDEYQIIYVQFKIEQFNSQSLVEECDLLNVKPSTYWPNKEIYFDASEILRKEAELFRK